VSTQSPYAARPWLQHYDYWVRPHMSYPGRPLGDILAVTAVHRPDRTATHFLGAELTYRDLKQRSDALAASLAGLGIVKGDRVGIMLPNCPQYIIAAFAILKLGAVVVNINPSYTPREFLVVAADSTPRIVIAMDALAPLVQGIRKETTLEHVIVTSLAEYSAAAAAPPRIDGTLALADLAKSGIGSDARQAPVTPPISADDLAVLQYTGGTTGTPKGAMLTHGNIFANVVQTVAWTNPSYILGGDERYLVVIPYFHIYAFSVCMMTGLWVGALQIIHPKYDPEQVLASIKQFRPTYFPAVPTVFVSLLNHPHVAESGLELVRHFNSGGAPCPVEVLEEFERRTGRPLMEGYGLSET
jgi:long-chain acyl-CoA synthetase